MVAVRKNGKDYHVSIHSREYFYECLGVVKGLGFRFSSDSKTWKTDDPRLVKEALTEISQYEKTSIGDLDIDTLSRQIERETKLTGIDFDPSLLRSNPIGPFQVEGIKRGVNQNRFFLAWEMGLGKTFTVVSIINHLWEQKKVDKVLIVAPTESIYNFRREFLRFNSFGLTESDFYIANVENREPFDSDAKIVIMAYHTFRMLSDDAYRKANGGKRSTQYRKPTLDIGSWGKSRAIVLDESHKIKNGKSRTAKLFHMYREFFEYRYLLTGTPAPNSPADLYTQIRFLDSTYVDKNYVQWLQRVADIGDRFSTTTINYFYPDRIKAFTESIKPLFSREMTEGNVVLPELSIRPIWVGLTKKQRAIYEGLIDRIVSRIKEKKEGENVVVEKKEITVQLPYLMQALDDPCLLKGKLADDPDLEKRVGAWKFSDHSQLPAVESLLLKHIEEQNQKVILWSGHPDTMNRLAEHFGKYSPIVLHGQNNIPKGMTSTEYRDQELNRFKSDPNHHLLIASYNVLSTAVNIVESSVAIYWDRSFDFTPWAQSLKRIHRIGQDKTVSVYPIVQENSIDERLHDVLEAKGDINNTLLKKQRLSLSEVRKMLRGELDKDNG
jgi:SNF2 family DNA or RNA helicase